MYKLFNVSKSGFTLIELLVCVAVVIVLTAMAAGIYKSFIIRAQIVEVFAYADAAKKNVEQFFLAHGTFPSSATEATYDHLVNNSDVVSGIYYYGCDQSDAHQFVMEIQPAVTGVSGNSIVMVVRNMGNGELKWYCRQAGEPPLSMDYLPSYCVSNTATTSFCDTSNTPIIDP